MRVTFLLLVIVASVFQNSRPSSSEGKQKESPAIKQDAATPIPERPQAKPKSESQDRPNKQESDAKTEPQQRPEKPPWWDVAWSTWALVVIGIVTAYIALGTLSDIKKQTEATKYAADAARKSARKD